MDPHDLFEPVVSDLLPLVASMPLALGGWTIARLPHRLGPRNAAQATAILGLVATQGMQGRDHRPARPRLPA